MMAPRGGWWQKEARDWGEFCMVLKGSLDRESDPMKREKLAKGLKLCREFERFRRDS